MKVVAFDGSARRQASPSAPRRARRRARGEGVETELVYLEKDRRTGCYMCGQCGHKRESPALGPPRTACGGASARSRPPTPSSSGRRSTPASQPRHAGVAERLDHDWLETERPSPGRQGGGRGGRPRAATAPRSWPRPHRQAARAQGNGGRRTPRRPCRRRPRGGLRERRDDRPGAGARRGLTAAARCDRRTYSGPAAVKPPGPQHAILAGERLPGQSRLPVLDLADPGRGMVHRLVGPRARRRRRPARVLTAFVRVVRLLRGALRAVVVRTHLRPPLTTVALTVLPAPDEP